MNYFRKKTTKRILTGLFTILTSLITYNAWSQDFSSIEKVQDENDRYMSKIYNIIGDYPSFSYSYNMEDGKIKSVSVTGVEDELDKKRIEVYLYDLKSNENKIKAKANRIGVFYSVDDKPKYKQGREELVDELYKEIDYPEKAKEWGVEATIFVKFVVDENGEIPYIATSVDSETPYEFYLKKLEEEAIDAVKATSGEWVSGKIDEVNVPSLAVIPISFDIENPMSIRLIN